MAYFVKQMQSIGMFIWWKKYSPLVCFISWNKYSPSVCLFCETNTVPRYVFFVEMNAIHWSALFRETNAVPRYVLFCETNTVRLSCFLLIQTKFIDWPCFVKWMRLICLLCFRLSLVVRGRWPVEPCHSYRTSSRSRECLAWEFFSPWFIALFKVRTGRWFSMRRCFSLSL